MALLSARDAETIKQRFEKDLTNPVEILLFTEKPSKLVIPGKQDCLYCKETQEMLEEVVALTDRLQLRIYDEKDEATRSLFGVTESPVIILRRAGDTTRNGVRYYGIPSGYEFSTLLEDLVDLSKGDSRLGPKGRDLAERIDKPIHLKVFVTPT